MNKAEFSATLKGLDRSRWPVQPGVAEQHIRDMLRWTDWWGSMPVLWVESPTELRKLARSRQRNHALTMAETLRAYRQMPQMPHNYWLAEDQAAVLADIYGGARFTDQERGLRAARLAWLAGAFAIAVYRDETYVLGRPVIHTDDQGRLHHDKKPAIAWPDGPYGWYLMGVGVEEHVITDPKAVTLDDIGDIANQEVRRVLVERFGWEKYLRALNAQPIDVDPVHGRLLRANVLRGDLDWRRRRQHLLEVKDPSTNRKYFIRVPLNRMTAISARAWTFNKTIKEFQKLVKET